MTQSTMAARPSTWRMIRHAILIFFYGFLANFILGFAVLVNLLSPVIDWKLLGGRQGRAEAWSWSLGCWTADKLWSWMQRHFENDLNAASAFSFSGDVDDLCRNEGAVVIANHQGYADYYLIFALASRCSLSGQSSSSKNQEKSEDAVHSSSGEFASRMRPTGRSMLGTLRFFAKKELVWQMPVFGWALWAIGMILVKRNWTSDAKLIEESFTRIKKSAHPCWIVSYLEGTRLTKAKVKKSQAFAREHGKPILSKVLLPRHKGFLATIVALRQSHIKYVYDLTLSYTSPSHPKSRSAAISASHPNAAKGADGRNDEQTLLLSGLAESTEAGRTPALDELLSIGDLAKAGYRFHVDVRRVAIADLPTDEAGLVSWIEDAWVRKDLLLRRLHGEEAESPDAFEGRKR